ncbi:MAG TPA: Gfo/Idh/MocA family oxidoreductase [Polyangiaceae bacterium]|nr:Gfo/Idh/MocA family oxidoreductase [Polyangiaceae bacterium]
MPKRLRLGMLGTGLAAKLLYLPALRALSSRIELVACANRRRSKAVAYAKLAGIPRVVNDADELFALPELDAVLISLPIHLQPRYVLQALAAGKAVLSEKPIAPNLREGKQLVKAAARFDKPWLVGENFAFMPQVARLQRWIQSGKLGQVRLVEAVLINAMNRKNPYFNTSWRAQPEHIGGFVVDAGVHLAEVLRRCFGMPTQVQNLTASFDPAVPPIDTALALLKFESGAVGTFTSCFSARYEGPFLRVYGSRANAELGYHGLTWLAKPGEPKVYPAERGSFEVQFAHFADVVLRGAPLAFTPDQALENLALMQAIVSP